MSIDNAMRGRYGSLVSISDANEQEHIYQLLTAFGEGEYAIGLKNDAWSDGNTATYRNIKTDQKGIIYSNCVDTLRV